MVRKKERKKPEKIEYTIRFRQKANNTLSHIMYTCGDVYAVNERITRARRRYNMVCALWYWNNDPGVRVENYNVQFYRLTSADGIYHIHRFSNNNNIICVTGIHSVSRDARRNETIANPVSVRFFFYFFFFSKLETSSRVFPTLPGQCHLHKYPYIPPLVHA